MAFTNVLSLFDPPAENPLSEAGAWAQTSTDRAPMRKTAIGDATDSSHGDPNYSHWVREKFYAGIDGPPTDAWGCLSGGQLGAALETWRVALWSRIAPSVQGYLVFFGGGLSKDLILRRYDGGFASFTAIGGVNLGGAYPSMMGVRINGPDVEAWYRTTGDWTFGFAVADSTYRGWFNAGIGVEDPTGGGLAFPCFGAGTENDPEFLLWMPSAAPA